MGTLIRDDEGRHFCGTLKSAAVPMDYWMFLAAQIRSQLESIENEKKKERREAEGGGAAAQVEYLAGKNTNCVTIAVDPTHPCWEKREEPFTTVQGGFVWVVHPKRWHKTPEAERESILEEALANLKDCPEPEEDDD